MKTIYLAMALTLGLSTAAQAGDPEAGKALTVVCAGCHGQDGNSLVPNFPKLAGLNEKYLIKQINDIKHKRRPIAAMVGQVDYMTDEQIADIAAYYASLPMSSGKAADENLALGAEIYRTGIAETGVAACASCHGATGAGNGPAGWPRLAGQHKDYIALQLRRWRTGAENSLEEDPEGRTNDGDSRFMRDVARRLSDNEIEAVSNFIAGLY
ncbi:MAG: c-type cytochrome [Pseudomonadota bacterium]